MIKLICHMLGVSLPFRPVLRKPLMLPAEWGWSLRQAWVVLTSLPLALPFNLVHWLCQTPVLMDTVNLDSGMECWWRQFSFSSFLRILLKILNSLSSLLTQPEGQSTGSASESGDGGARCEEWRQDSLSDQVSFIERQLWVYKHKLGSAAGDT